MQHLMHELELRKEEVNGVLEFLKFMENDGELSRKLKESMDNNYMTVITSIKAGMVLMLYNAVESTMTKGLENLHVIFMEQNLGFDECNEAIKQLLFVYYENVREKSTDIHHRVPHMLQLYDYMKGEQDFPLSYKQLCQFYSLYSGNLDSREIVLVLKKYGIEFEEKISELKTIKDNRNQLAHGELTFEEVGRRLSVPQLENMSGKTFEYMGKVVDVMSNFVAEQKYKRMVEFVGS